jgi:hypothetical protein
LCAVDGNGVLDRKELKLLAQDCIDRTMKMYEDEFRRLNPNLNAAQVQKSLEKEKQFMIPGKNKQESQREIVKRLVRKLDVNGDGKGKQNILKTSFYNLFCDLISFVFVYLFSDKK